MASNDDKNEKVFKISEPDTVLWTDFAKDMAEIAGISGEALDFFPKICYLYCAILPLCRKSNYDTDEYNFPFTDEEIAKGVWYTAAYGETSGHAGVHRGIDLGTNDANLPFYSVADGTVKEAGDGDAYGSWHGILVQHGDGTYALYLHCATINVSAGQQVSKGDLLGTTGGYGQNGPNTYAVHLHLEMGHGDGLGNRQYEDPLDFFPKMKAEVPLQSQLKTA